MTAVDIIVFKMEKVIYYVQDSIRIATKIIILQLFGKKFDDNRNVCTTLTDRVVVESRC